MKKHLPNFFSPRVFFSLSLGFLFTNTGLFLALCRIFRGEFDILTGPRLLVRPLDVLVVVRNVMEPKSKPGFWKEIDVLVSVGTSRKFGDE